VPINEITSAQIVRAFHAGVLEAHIRTRLWYTDYWHVSHVDTFCQLFDVRSQVWVARKPDHCED
jgi:hypothetical protein